MSVSKSTIETTGQHACLRDGANLTPFMPVLALITRVIPSIHGSFSGFWKQGFFKVIFGTILAYDLWKNFLNYKRHRLKTFKLNMNVSSKK